MIPYFQSLGERLERTWQDSGYDENRFSELASTELTRVPPSGHVEVTEVFDWIFGPSGGFLQPSSQELFGQPPVMVFQAPRFYIEVLFWLAGTTGVHEHAFSGALTVLAGSSVHSHWRFEPSGTINSRMHYGKLERVSTEILRPGDIRPIYPGDRLIHQLFHLEVPSVTVVVRTNVDRRYLPQYEYLPPGLAVDSEDREGSRTRRMAFLDGMARGHFSELEKYARRLVESGDLETIYHTFAVLTRRRVDPEFLGKLFDAVRQRHGAVADLFQQVCQEQRRIRLVTSLRAKVVNPRARFLLALLMLMSDRDAILETVALEYPEVEPLAAIESWLELMSGKEIIGFDLDSGANRLIVRGLMAGWNREQMVEALRGEYSDDSIVAYRERLLSHAERLARSDLFWPLFSKSPMQEESAWAM